MMYSADCTSLEECPFLGRWDKADDEGEVQMKALDTNVLVRFLARVDEREAETIYRIFKQAESDKEVFFVLLLVVLEFGLFELLR